MKTRVQNRNNKRTAIERFDWFIERIQTCVAFVWLNERSGKKLHAWELSRNHPLLRFDVTLLHDWPVERWVLHIRVLFGGKTKRPRFDLFIHWLIKQITNTCRNHFSRSYENCSNFSEQLGSKVDTRKLSRNICGFLWPKRTFFLRENFIYQSLISGYCRSLCVTIVQSHAISYFEQYVL